MQRQHASTTGRRHLRDLVRVPQKEDRRVSNNVPSLGGDLHCPPLSVTKIVIERVVVPSHSVVKFSRIALIESFCGENIYRGVERLTCQRVSRRPPKLAAKPQFAGAPLHPLGF